MNTSLMVVNSHDNPSKNVPGRLNYEFNTNPKKAILRINEAINMAALVMGLHPGAEVMAVTATEVVKEILEQYPQAPVEDIAKALKMASFGEIKFDGQLNTLSAMNIFKWYKIFRLEHSDKSTIPPLPIPMNENQLSEAEKKAVVRTAFYDFVSHPKRDALALNLFYDRLVVIKAIDASNEARIAAYHVEAEKLTQAPPLDFFKDHAKRKQVFAFQDAYKKYDGLIPFDFSAMAENCMHKRAIDQAKSTMVMTGLKRLSVEEIMALYDKHYSK